MSMSSLDSADMLLLFHLQCDFSSCAYSSRSSWGKAAVQRSPTLSRPKVGVKQQCFICPHTRLSYGLTYRCCFSEGSEILDQMLQCLEHLPKPMPQLEVSSATLPHEQKSRPSVFDKDSLSFVCVSSGLSRHDGSVSHVSSGRGVPHSGKPSGHAGKATDGR